MLTTVGAKFTNSVANRKKHFKTKPDVIAGYSSVAALDC